MPKMPPRGLIRYFQRKTITPPAAMPETAPAKVVRFQYRAQITRGPKPAPKPAQAKETMPKMELLGSFAMKMPRMAMAMTVSRAASILCFWLSLKRNASCSRFWDTLEDAASSWESAVDMVLARMPARMRPAISAGKMPPLAKSSAMRMMTVSVLEPSRGAMAPMPDRALPTMPISTARAMATVTQTEATRRLSFSFFSSPMAMNRSRIWGIPK